MIKLKEILLSELSHKSTLYHRSLKKMEVGDIIKPNKDKSGQHWLKSIPVEIILEEYRKKHFPNAPSRINGIYSTVVPRSRFVNKGYLYVIKPIGKMLISDYKLIDEIKENFDREISHQFRYDSKVYEKLKENPENYYYFMDNILANEYWNGKIYNYRNKIEDIEVLSESAQVLEVIEEDRIVPGNNVKVTESDKIYCSLTIYLKKDLFNKYKDKSDDKLNKFIKDCENIFSKLDENKFTEYSVLKSSGNIELKGYLKKGIKLKVISLNYPSYKKYSYYEDYIKSKFVSAIFNLFLNGKYYSSVENNVKNGLPDYSMRYFYNYDENVKDISKFLKIVR